MQGVLYFIGKSGPSARSYILHHKVLNFILVAMSTQLRLGSCPRPKDVHPFIDAIMNQDGDLVTLIIRRLLLNFIDRSHMPFSSHYTIYSNGNQPRVLQRVGSTAANIMLVPYYTFNYLASSSVEGSRSSLAAISLHVLLVLVHYITYVVLNESMALNDVNSVDSTENPYSKALNNARDIEFDRANIEGNAIEYILVQTDLDTLLLPILETLYNASKRTPNQIYMLLIILLILSQDSSFNASIHKLILPSVPWYEECLVHQTSLGSSMVLVLIRTVKYNLSKLRDIYLHTNGLAIFTNMAHMIRLSSHASLRHVSLFDLLLQKYTKLVELNNDKNLKVSTIQTGGGIMTDYMSPELHLYAEILRIVLETLNAILTYALS